MNITSILGSILNLSNIWLNKENHPCIYSSGQRKNDGKWWFIWRQATMDFDTYRASLTNLRSTGFNIPDYKNTGKKSQLIAEPFKDIDKLDQQLFSCVHCETEINLGDKDIYDYARLLAI